MPLTRRTAATALLAMFSVAGLNACRDEALAPPGVVASAVGISARTSATVAQTAAQVSFDVDVASTRSTSSATTMHLHVDRTRGVGNGWTSIVTLPSQSALPNPPGNELRPTTAKIDEAGQVTVYQKNGAVWKPMTYSDIMAQGYKLLTPRTPAESAKAVRLSQLLATQKNGSVFHARWIEALVRSSSERHEEVVAAVRGFAQGATDSRGHNHYSRVQGNSSIDIDVDPATDNVGGIVSTEDGVPATNTTNRYAEGPPGWSIRRESHAENFALHGQPGRTATVTLSNIVINGQRIP
jgi:hypothetical protein